MTYVSPFGRIQGLGSRLQSVVDRLRKDRSFPWQGTGLIDDLELIMKLISLEDFVDWLRVNGPEEHQHFADEIFAKIVEGEQLDALQEHIDKKLDPAEEDKSHEETINKAHASVENLDAIMNALRQLGAIDDTTKPEDIPALLKVLFL